MNTFENIDFAAFSLPELRALKAHLEHNILPAREQAERKIGIDKVSAIMRDFGITAADLQPSRKDAQRKPVAMRYQNPDNPAQQWSGRGRAPVWVMEAEQRGIARSQMEILQQGKAPSTQAA